MIGVILNLKPGIFGDENVNEGRLRQEFPHIHARVQTLGLQYVFIDQSDCNLSLVIEFYSNWNVCPVEINKVFVRENGCDVLLTG